jgi:predicted outer membrane repeat protein
MFCLLGQKVNATDYHVGTSQPIYKTLDELRIDIGIIWNDDDEIILHHDDDSLLDAFNFNGKAITISGNAKVSPSSTSNIRFSTTLSNTTSLTIVDGSSITFDGFNYNGYGGAIYSDGNVEIFGTSTFIDNTANYNGGAIYSGGNVEISGTSTFADNSANNNNSGGAIYSNGNVEISGTSTFVDNKANYSGGAIFSTGNVEISGTSTFTNNKANNNNNSCYAPQVKNETSTRFLFGCDTFFY